VIPKVCSADHWWSARLAEVVRKSPYKSIFCPSRTTKFLWVVHEPKKFGNHWLNAFKTFLPLWCTQILHRTSSWILVLSPWGFESWWQEIQITIIAVYSSRTTKIIRKTKVLWCPEWDYHWPRVNIKGYVQGFLAKYNCSEVLLTAGFCIITEIDNVIPAMPSIYIVS